MKRIIVELAAVFCSLPVEAQKHACSIADLYRTKNVEDPQISPDGKRIAFVLKEDDLTRGASSSAVYVMDADGRDQRSLNTTGQSNTHPRWSPDGSALLFFSTRTNTPQTWLLPLGGGERPKGHPRVRGLASSHRHRFVEGTD